MASMLVKNLRRVVNGGGRQPMVASLNNYFTYANEISHPLNRMPPNVTPEEAVQCIQSGEFNVQFKLLLLGHSARPNQI